MKNKKRIKNTGFFILAILVYILGFFVFYRLFSLEIAEIIHSDTYVHVSSALNGRGYSFLGVIYNLLYNLTHSVESIAVFLSLCHLLLAILTGWIIKKFLENREIHICWGASLFSGFLCLFICKIYIPYLSPTFYSTSFITQPWHNMTYSLMRIPALATVWVYLKIESKYLKKFKIGDAVVFTLLLTITNAIKPSFVLFFSIMMLIYLFRDLIVTKGRSLLKNIEFGCCVLISLLVLVWQSTVLFPSDSGGISGGIAISFEKVFTFFSSPGTVIGMIVSLIFPLLVLFWARWKGKDIRYLNKIWIMFIIAVIESFVLVETGARAADGNFVWGRYCAGFFLYLFSFIQYLELIKKRDRHNNTENVLTYVNGTLCALSILCGLVYFYLYAYGGVNYIM